MDPRDASASKKIAGDRFTSHKSADIELHLWWGSKTFSQQIFPTELVMSASEANIFGQRYFPLTEKVMSVCVF